MYYLFLAGLSNWETSEWIVFIRKSSNVGAALIVFCKNRGWETKRWVRIKKEEKEKGYTSALVLVDGEEVWLTVRAVKVNDKHVQARQSEVLQI